MTVYKLRERGANITVVANGEVLFMPGGPVHGWTRKFANQTKRWVSAAAPTNRRPRWSHYGKPLKQTIMATSPRFRKVREGARLYAAVGSNAPHAYYVDQGTGVYAGRGPYQGKILPPWTRGGPTLYEHTFRVPKGSHQERDGSWVQDWEEVGTVTIKGQKGQGYFDSGLKRAFMFMLRSSQQITTNPKVAAAMASWPEGLEDFKGNTPADGPFMAQLKEWRAWRDAAFGTGGVARLGRTYVTPSQARRENQRAERSRLALIDRRKKAASRQALWRERHPDAVAKYNASRRVREEQRKAKDTRGATERAIDSFIDAIKAKYGAQTAGDARLKVRVITLPGGRTALFARGVLIRLPNGALDTKDFRRTLG